MTSQTQKETERFEKRTAKPEEDKNKFQGKIKEQIEIGVQKKL